MSKLINKIWWSKYRPKNIDGMILLPRIKNQLFSDDKLSLDNNYLFVGPPGVGKSSLAKVIVPKGALYVNASYNSSIDDLKEEVAEYCKTADIFGDSTIDGYKIVYLDEFDGVSQKYQEGLRAFIEEHESHVRFIATCCAKDTKVYTKYGYQLIQNIKNEKLYTHLENNFQENQQIIINEVDHIIKIKTLHNFKIDVTPTHQFLNENIWSEANTLKETDNIDIDLKPLFGNNYRLEKYYDNKFIDLKQFKKYLSDNNIFYKKELDKIKNDKILKLNKRDFIIFDELKKYKKYKQTKYRTKYFSKDEITKICKQYNHGFVYIKNMINRFLDIGILLQNDNVFYFSNSGKAIKSLEKYLNNYIKNNYYNKDIEKIKTIQNPTNIIYTIEDIIEKLENILNIKNNELDKISALGRILGMLYGDGCINGSTLAFAAYDDDVLEKIKKDLILLFNDTDNAYNFIQNGKHSNGRMLNFFGKAYTLLFNFLGCPIGNKVLNNNLNVPDKCYKHKHFFRTFIQGLFDCEMNTYRFDKNNKTVRSLVFRQHTSNKNYNFHVEITKLLKKYFDIDATTYIKDANVSKSFIDNSNIKKYLSTITCTNNENILKYMENIGNYYENKNIRYDIYGYILYKQGQVGYKFLTFDEWKNKYYKGNGIISDVIKDIYNRKKRYKRKVYDCSLNAVHSYNTNGFISHNCNSISKISDAMQSRFDVINFEPETEEERKFLKDEYIERCKLIRDKNDVNMTDSQIENIIEINFPDLRSVINLLQKVHKVGSFSKDLNDSVNLDLFNIIFENAPTEKTYDWVISNFGDNTEFLLRTCGRPLINYILSENQKYINKIPRLTKITTDHLSMLYNTPDPLLLSLSCIFEIQEAIKK